jgi:hypothetical protein
MRRMNGGVAFVLALALAGAGCDPKTTNTPTTPTTPTDPTTESFSGTVGINAAVTFSFAVLREGYVTATIKTLAPETEAKIGLALGTWNGQTCQLVLTNDTATQSRTVTGYANGVSALCVRIYDVGSLTQVNNFEITVVHP